MAPPQHAEPFWIARFDRLVNGLTLFCRPVRRRREKHKAHLELPVMYPLDQLLLMYFLARRRGILTARGRDGQQGKAFIFAAHRAPAKALFPSCWPKPGSGKLLSDERMIVREIDGAMQAFGTPWAGTAGIARNGDAPLAGIFFLKHGRANRIEKLAAAEALDRLLPLVSIPWYDPDAAVARSSPSPSGSSAAAPAYELSFTPDRSAVEFFRQFHKEPYPDRLRRRR